MLITLIPFPVYAHFLFDFSCLSVRVVVVPEWAPSCCSCFCVCRYTEPTLHKVSPAAPPQCLRFYPQLFSRGSEKENTNQTLVIIRTHHLHKVTWQRKKKETRLTFSLLRSTTSGGVSSSRISSDLLLLNICICSEAALLALISCSSSSGEGEEDVERWVRQKWLVLQLNHF